MKKKLLSLVIAAEITSKQPDAPTIIDIEKQLNRNRQYWVKQLGKALQHRSY